MFILILQRFCQDAMPCNKKEKYGFPFKGLCAMYSHLSGNVLVKTEDFVSLSSRRLCKNVINRKLRFKILKGIFCT